ncbi:hypothetical protein BDN67DRAFT_985546 [Paxillus ammoniavirescens]|nr:hypothetical protein BDN67DRAFT_985546 [Paxillus ammoniavirescens]
MTHSMGTSKRLGYALISSPTYLDIGTHCPHMILTIQRFICGSYNLQEKSLHCQAHPLAVMKPAEVMLEVFNSQYLQLHSLSPLAILTFTKDALKILSYLQIKSPRADKFRIACDDRFLLSKVFKSADERGVLRYQCIESKNGDDVEKDFQD